MQTLILFVLALAILVPAAAALLFERRPVTFVHRRTGVTVTRHLLALRFPFRPPLRGLANYDGTSGTHMKAITRLSDVDVATRFLIFKAGSDDGHLTIAGAADYPVGVCQDHTRGQMFLLGQFTFATYPMAFQLFGNSPETTRMQAAGAITAGTPVFSAAIGQCQAQPVAAGTYYHLGTALTSAVNAGDIIEVDTCIPRKIIV